MKALSDLKLSVAKINLEICQKKCEIFVGSDYNISRLQHSGTFAKEKERRI